MHQPADLLSIVVPTFNEAERLRDSLDPMLALSSPTCEVLFVDDGSTDGTGDLLADAARDLEHVSVLRLAHNRGKGAAVRLGAAHARGASFMFMDADLATGLEDIEPLVRALDDHDVAIGSRAVEGAEIHGASRRRSAMGGAFNRLVRVATGVPFRDTQCGFKGFRAPTGKLLFALSRLDGFAFDVELMALAGRLGLTTREVPVHWTERDGSHIRPIVDPIRMAVDVLHTTRIPSTRAARVTALTFPCSEGLELAVESELRQCFRSSDLSVLAQGSVSVLLPFISTNETASMAARGAEIADVSPSAVRQRALNLFDVVRMTRASMSSWPIPVSALAPVDPAPTVVPAVAFGLAAEVA